MSNNRPWDFDEARQKCLEASRRQEAAENSLREAHRAAALKQEAYAIAFANKILELRAEGYAVTACADIARGEPKVAALRRDRDIAEGVREAMSQTAWRLTADRKDAQRFADWSQRREFAEAHGNTNPTYDRPVGLGAAA